MLQTDPRRPGGATPERAETQARQRRRRFQLFLIKPSHYDDEGYLIQWWRSDIPSNSMAVVNAIALDCRDRAVLGADVEIEITVVDEINSRIRPAAIAARCRRAEAGALVCLVGVQSNQYPRAVDIARPLRAAGVQVSIGGFHVSGCLAMLPKLPSEIAEALELGISIFAGEAEGRFEALLRDAAAGALAPLYNHMDDLPGLEGAPTPFLSRKDLRRSMTTRTSFDSGRGCPFQCSFCTIINVQGRKSRYRSADDIEQILRENHAQGVTKFFITDDNFARNKNWESIFDRIIALKAEGLVFRLIIQVDTLCHRIAGFVDKAGQAGVDRVFIGLENVNPENLAGAKKKQNRITEYRSMLQAWKSIGAITFCGYIVGFPADTRESVLRDVEIMKRELPVDLVEFFILTPLPGSEDHQRLDAKGVAMDPDMNNYDTEHVTTAHPKMSAEELRATYRDAWHSFYAADHMQTVMRRAAACGVPPGRVAKMAAVFYGTQAIEGIHPLQGGLLRRKVRGDRRPGLPLESRRAFYPRYLWETAGKLWRFVRLYRSLTATARAVAADPARGDYMDLALTAAADADLDSLEIFEASAAAKAVAAKARGKRPGSTGVAAPVAAE